MPRIIRTVLTTTLIMSASVATWAQAQNADRVQDEPRPAATQPGTTPAADLPNAVDLISANLKAMGGKKAWDAIESTMIKATMTSPMGDIGMEMYSKKPDKFLVKQILPGMGEAASGSDGQTAWTKPPMGGPAQLLDAQQSAQMQRQSSMYRMTVNMLEDYTGHATVEKVTFNDVESHKVSMKDEEGVEQFAYFGVTDGMLQGFDLAQPTPRGSLKSTIKVSDWEQKGDVKVFKKMVVSMQGQSIPIVFNEVEFNTLEDSAFAVPADVQALKDKKNGAATQPAGTPPSTAPGAGEQ